MTVADPLPLRERKKLRTRQALAETAVAMFTGRGFDATTLDALVEAVEVSKRTFFRNFRSKEDVALTAIKQFWGTVLEVLEERQATGPLLESLRDVLLEALGRMDDYWFRQFRPTLSLVESSPALQGHTLRYCSEIQRDVVRRLGRGETLELRLLVELVVAVWRAAVAEWPPTGSRAELAEHIESAFAAIPRSLSLR
ncbi:TetR family transcriptional regulator [Amycolatopsis acidicola]|uniref:TetR family transcriptional regulator n=1 Tax=Amycolatopsis acidicola TaxID=2596893 RepID=A0A5N0V601_9PSEU|nr:TetR family transcriptional regulator [Amycolatopsis acidicola]KAA9161839.1 TetR family transcriptional regulator [Amycolatopsis acidicola]